MIIYFIVVFKDSSSFEIKKKKRNISEQRHTKNSKKTEKN
jgi:hypothetical protein